MDKARIKLSFSNAARNYDSLASLQKEAAEKLMDFGFRISDFGLSLTTHHLPLTTILDIGCGTGFLTHRLAHALPEANIFGCDISHYMIKVAKGNNSGQWSVSSGQNNERKYFLAADGEFLSYKDETFDMIVSNLTYQWISDTQASFLEAYRVLRPEGVFIFSVLGPETLKELRYCYIEASSRFNRNGLPPFMGFSDKQMLQSDIENAGFKNISIKKANIIKTYPDMWALLRAMKSIGAGNPFKEGDKSLARGSLLKKMAEVYREKFKSQKSKVKIFTGHCIYATYEVMFVYGEKPHEPLAHKG